MGLVVDDVPTAGLKIERDPSILSHREDVEQLFQVGTMILAMAPGNGWCCQLSKTGRGGLQQPFLLGIRIVAEEGDGRGVVVQFLQLHAKLLDDLPDHRQHQLRVERGEDSIQAPPHPIIVQVRQFVRP